MRTHLAIAKLPDLAAAARAGELMVSWETQDIAEACDREQNSS
ncbi:MULTISPECIES: hypothetical protein [Prauserella]|nr:MULTISPECIES: hypothetical protein [Prauserella]